MNWYRNLRIRSKLFSSFGTVIVFTVMLAVLAILTVNRIDSSYSYLLEYPQKRVEYLLQVDARCSDMQQATSYISLNIGNSEAVDNDWEQFNQAYNDAVYDIDQYLSNNNLDMVRDPTT